MPDNCRGRPSRIEHGYFRGSIGLRGEREFTIVDRAGAPGRVIQSYRNVCNNGLGADFFETGGRKFTSTVLFSGAEGGTSKASFMANETEFGQTVAGPSFSAYAIHFREGMSVSTSVQVQGDRGDFTIPQRGVPKISQVEPPAPFEGSATFRLTGPKTSTWEGDLAVELPGLGRVPLAGPSYWSAYCQNLQCTDTVPSNVSIAIVSRDRG